MPKRTRLLSSLAVADGRLLFKGGVCADRGNTLIVAYLPFYSCALCFKKAFFRAWLIGGLNVQWHTQHDKWRWQGDITCRENHHHLRSTCPTDYFKFYSFSHTMRTEEFQKTTHRTPAEVKHLREPSLQQTHNATLKLHATKHWPKRKHKSSKPTTAQVNPFIYNKTQQTCHSEQSEKTLHTTYTKEWELTRKREREREATRWNRAELKENEGRHVEEEGGRMDGWVVGWVLHWQRCKKTDEGDFRSLTFIRFTQSQVQRFSLALDYRQQESGEAVNDPDQEWRAIQQCRWRWEALVLHRLIISLPLLVFLQQELTAFSERKCHTDIVELLLYRGDGRGKDTAFDQGWLLGCLHRDSHMATNCHNNPSVSSRSVPVLSPSRPDYRTIKCSSFISNTLWLCIIDMTGRYIVMH